MNKFNSEYNKSTTTKKRSFAICLDEENFQKNKNKNMIDLTVDECISTPKKQLKQSSLDVFFSSVKQLSDKNDSLSCSIDSSGMKLCQFLYDQESETSTKIKHKTKKEIKTKTNINHINFKQSKWKKTHSNTIVDQQITSTCKTEEVIDLCSDLNLKLEESKWIDKSQSSKFIPLLQKNPTKEDNLATINLLDEGKRTMFQKQKPGTIESEKNQCPSYKVIEGTNFAVDAFNYGHIQNVTAYFLTHFHTDHYIGLTKKFSMPIYASEITIKFIREFLSIDAKFLNVVPLNRTFKIDGIYVTAIDANHCPGAIMILFQLPCGKQILHTGDFRWSPKMEIDLKLHQQQIDLIYLDTTNISNRHVIYSQEECISKAINCVREFKQHNENKKILFVVCTDVLGKENFWLTIAKTFNMKVWSDGKRRKALSIIGNKEILNILVSDPKEADLHVLSHSEAGYKQLNEYFNKFSDCFDKVLSIKPKGVESLALEFGDKVNSISVRYSEHSTQQELRKFLRFLLPKRVISTVPLSNNIFRCPKVPISWHTLQLYVPYTKQTSLLNYVVIKDR